MYLPAAFAETDPAALQGFIRQHPFGLLAAADEEGRVQTAWIPFTLADGVGPKGTLYGHVARANPIWRHVAARPALAQFVGPHGYVSPRWFETEPAVPTWNYALVEARGPLRLIEDEASLYALVDQLAGQYEQGDGAWSLKDQPERFTAGLLKVIVGFALEIESLEGKFKLSQNRPEKDRLGVIGALEAQGDPESLGLAGIMRRAMKS